MSAVISVHNSCSVGNGERLNQVRSLSCTKAILLMSPTNETQLIKPDGGKRCHESAEEQQNRHKRVLLLIRILFLTLYASMGSIQPYLPVYYHSLGHSGLVIGVLGAIRPLVTFLVSPLWGVLADKTDNRTLVLKIALAGWVATQLLMAFRDDAMYLVGIVFIMAVFQAPIRSLTDSVVLAQLNENDQYGRLRLFGQLGMGLGTSAVGLLVSRANAKVLQPTEPTMTGNPIGMKIKRVWSGLVARIARSPAPPEPLASSFVPSLRERTVQFYQDLDLSGYRLAFCSFGVLSILTWLCLQALGRASKTSQRGSAKTKKKEAARIYDGLLMLLHNSDALLFLFLVFVVGLSSGCTENFAYVRMQEVGATSNDIGFSRLMGSTAGATMFWYSGNLTKTMGPVQLLVLTPLTYATRFFIYAFMKKPHHAFPAETLRGVAFAAFWSTATTYAHRISPPGMDTTMVSTIGVTVKIWMYFAQEFIFWNVVTIIRSLCF